MGSGWMRQNEAIPARRLFLRQRLALQGQTLKGMREILEITRLSLLTVKDDSVVLVREAAAFCTKRHQVELTAAEPCAAQDVRKVVVDREVARKRVLVCRRDRVLVAA